MKKLTINLVLPFPATKPGGGSKIMYEIANRLNERGHNVAIYHSIKRPFKKSKTPTLIKQVIFYLRNVARPKWFPLHEEISSVIVPEISDKYIRDADVIMSTWWQMTYAIHHLSSSKGKKFNFIQGYEIWAGQKEKVLESYSLPVHHLVIAKYLEQLIISNTNKKPAYIPLAIDDKKFYCITDPEKRNPFSVIMLYSKENVKGSTFGLTALHKVKEKIPELVVTFFGVETSPPHLPSWITYHQRPRNLNELYNANAIFISPSVSEGWALPPAEAMCCGCALVVTNISGHHDYAFENETALLVPAEDADKMFEKITILIKDHTLRNRLAHNAIALMKKEFNWDNTISTLENIYLTA